MSVFCYPNSSVWWIDFWFDKKHIRQSTKQRSKTVAREIERARRVELEQSYNGIIPRFRLKTLNDAASEYLAKKKGAISDNTIRIINGDLKHLLPVLGKKYVTDLKADHLKEYQALRLSQGAAPRTINMETADLRSILIRNKCWANIKVDFRMLEVPESPGIALDRNQERKLLAACKKSRSLSLYPRTMLTLCTGVRTGEIRNLRWHGLDLRAEVLTVGRSKTAQGKGRKIPLNGRALSVMKTWAKRFPSRQPDHFVFPYERYGGIGNKFADKNKFKAYGTDPTRPFGSWKTAWKAVHKIIGFKCRFHDLRHTACTRMLEGNIPFAVVAAVMGWTASTTILMTKRYGHIGQEAFTKAVKVLDDSAKQRQKKRAA